jgi:hypothetical protein
MVRTLDMEGPRRRRVAAQRAAQRLVKPAGLPISGKPQPRSLRSVQTPFSGGGRRHRPMSHGGRPRDLNRKRRQRCFEYVLRGKIKENGLDVTRMTSSERSRASIPCRSEHHRRLKSNFVFPSVAHETDATETQDQHQPSRRFRNRRNGGRTLVRDNKRPRITEIKISRIRAIR